MVTPYDDKPMSIKNGGYNYAKSVDNTFYVFFLQTWHTVQLDYIDGYYLVTSALHNFFAINVMVFYA